MWRVDRTHRGHGFVAVILLPEGLGIVSFQNPVLLIVHYILKVMISRCHYIIILRIFPIYSHIFHFIPIYFQYIPIFSTTFPYIHNIFRLFPILLQVLHRRIRPSIRCKDADGMQRRNVDLEAENAECHLGCDFGRGGNGC